MKHVCKTIKRIFSFTLALFFLLALFPLSVFASEAVTNGTFGDALVWTLDAEGTLTISGAGAMPDYTYTSHAPWYNSRNTIKGVIIDNGVENIGDFAFIGCSRLESVIIGDNVTCIGDRAFDGCISLDSISIPENVAQIGVMAFVGCKSLSIIYFEGDAPKFEFTQLDGSGLYASFCFQDVTATVYYPEDNTTWTDEIMQDYDGIITWVPYETEGETDINPDGNDVSIYIPVVEACMDECQYSSLSIEKQQECRGLLYDFNGDGQDELVLQCLKDRDIAFEIWSVVDGKLLCVSSAETFSGGLEANGGIGIGEYGGVSYVAYMWENTGMEAFNELELIYAITDNAYELCVSVKSYDLENTKVLISSNYYWRHGGQSEGLVFPELISYLQNSNTHTTLHTVEEIEQMVADYYNRHYQDEAHPGTYVVFHGETTVSGNTCNIVVRFQSSSSSPTTAANVLVAFVSVDMRTGVMTIETIDGDIEVRLFDADGEHAVEESWGDYEDYARNEWIEQHMEYAASDDYENEIIGGFNNRMMAVFRDALDDEDIGSYETRKAICALLNLDIELSEADMYELIIAEILFGERGQYITEETYNHNLRNSVANTAKVLVNIATTGDIAKEIPADALDNIKDSYELLQTLEFGTEEYGTTYSKLVSLLKGNVKELKSKLKTKLVDDAAFTGLGIVIDGAFEQYEALEDILSYINNYAAYQSTSKQLHDVLGHLLVVIYMHQGNKGLDGVDEFIDELGLWDAMTNWADLQTAVISVMEAMAAYEQEGAAAIAEYAVAREREAGHKFGAKALKSVTVFAIEKAASCVPVINTILLVKNVANVVISATVILDQIFTNVDEREYALDILTKSYCISVMLDQTVDNCVDCMSEDDFYSTTVFDEAVSIYKKNLLFASAYALKYADMVLANAEEELREYDEGWSIDHLFTSRDKLVTAVAWYSNSYKLLQEQQIKIQEITCHDSNLQYDPVTDEIIYNFEDSRIYVVACPVDVVIRNETGEQIAYLSGEENEVTDGYEFYFHTIKTTDDSGEYIKVAIIPNGYQIELIGTDDGTMNAFVTDFTTGDVGMVETYFNIPIEKDSVGYFEVSSKDGNESSLVMDQVTYSNMESVEDIPTNSESNVVWSWIVGGPAVCVIFLIFIFKKKSRK